MRKQHHARNHEQVEGHHQSGDLCFTGMCCGLLIDFGRGSL